MIYIDLTGIIMSVFVGGGCTFLTLIVITLITMYCNINDISPRICRKIDDILDFHLNWVFVPMTILYALLIYKIKFIS